MVVPSVQEAYGQTASEAMACGTPVVAFRATGLLDIVHHQESGFLAKPFDTNELAQGIAWVLTDRERNAKLCLQSREQAENEFAQEIQAKRYESLFIEVMTQK
jgi:glycosyltransferase involved in cell wall biosynthesis